MIKKTLFAVMFLAFSVSTVWAGEPIKPREPEIERCRPKEPKVPLVKVSPFWSIAPFGASQFMNGDYVKGAVFLGSQVLLAYYGTTLFIASNDTRADLTPTIGYIVSFSLFGVLQVCEIMDSIFVYKEYKHKLEVYPNAMIIFNQEMEEYRLAEIKYQKEMELYEIAMEKYLNSIFTQREREAIRRNNLFIGMSERALIESWGLPEDINTTITAMGTHKQYCYSNNQYVYVDNGEITTIQQ